MRVGLTASMLLLASAPLFVPDDYSVVRHTLSEAGGQGVDGAWAERSGVILAAATVFAMSLNARQIWPRAAVFWVRLYVLALVLLVAFPESPWDGGPHDPQTAALHTVAGVCAAVSFLIAVVIVSARRPHGQVLRKLLDWIVVAAIALVPQIMLVTAAPGLWQRVMVLLGYAWLFAELGRITASAGDLAASNVDSHSVGR